MVFPVKDKDIDEKHPVISLLLRRLKATLEGKGDPDKEAHLAVAVEGGGVRGAVSAGMLLALEQLGACDIIDSVYGSSAGAMNVSFFVTDEGPLGATVYYDAINNKQFINFGRILTKHPVVNLDYLLNKVLEYEVPLDWNMVVSSDTPVNIIATNLDTKDSDVIKNLKSKREIKKALRASSTIPILGGDPVRIRGHHYIDASFTESIPYKSVLNDGATHVLILSSRSGGQERSSPNPILQAVGSYLVESYAEGLGQLFKERPRRYKEDLREIEHMTSNPGSTPHVYRVTTPPGSNTVGKFEKDRQTIINGLISGAITMLREIGIDNYSPTEVLNFYSSKGKEMKRHLNISK